MNCVMWAREELKPEHCSRQMEVLLRCPVITHKAHPPAGLITSHNPLPPLLNPSAVCFLFSTFPPF